MLEKGFRRFLKNKKRLSPSGALILLGTVFWSLTMVKSGLVYPFGMGFWGPNGHDGVWHLSLIKSLSQGSFEMPVFAGEVIRNYHLGFDLLLALIHRVTFIPIHTLYFQIIPPLFALLIGLLTKKLILLWRRDERQAFWALFFVYFGSGWGFLVSLLREGAIGGESLFWSQQAISTLINPPFALSLVVVLWGLTLLFKRKGVLLPSLVFASLIQIKVYGGLLVLAGLLIAGFWERLKEKKARILKVFSLTFVFSLLFFLPFNRSSFSLVEFKPFWFLETMMQFPDRLNWPRYASAMVNYRLGGQWFKAALAYLVAFLVFWYGNMGLRFISEIGLAKWVVKKKIDPVIIFFLTVILAGAFLPQAFLQRGTPWNTIQFFYYSLFFSGLLAGVALGELAKKTNIWRRLLLSTIVLLTIPPVVGTLRHYLPSRPPAKISGQELAALKFLERLPEGRVLTPLFDRDKARAAEASPPRPLYIYESTAYVSAFSGKKVFLEDEVNLDITGYAWRERREATDKFLEALQNGGETDFLKTDGISYLYWPKEADPLKKLFPAKKIFENDEVTIYQVDSSL